MPVLMVQVLDDAWTRNPEDAQKTFDLLGSEDKELFWIENTTRRFKPTPCGRPSCLAPHTLGYRLHSWDTPKLACPLGIPHRT